MDFFVVPTVTARLLYVLVVMNHERRKIVHFNITDAPTAAWTAQQVINAFPYDTAPEYLLRDRDSIYGSLFVHTVNMPFRALKLGYPNVVEFKFWWYDGNPDDKSLRPLRPDGKAIKEILGTYVPGEARSPVIVGMGDCPPATFL